MVIIYRFYIQHLMMLESRFSLNLKERLSYTKITFHIKLRIHSIKNFIEFYKKTVSFKFGML
jgi:hypothetical protein